ncbi:helix-turn-helix domain-containing protein [Pedobacter jamesrossensis]|uniref:Helix-turn-helix domain-containing protein n=1 Tax=Pedobacter jamesrossensis TaxID=1908238 RepID=A0ABV8NJP7_9SPHI
MGGENFIGEYIFSYQVSGSLEVSDGINKVEFKAGDFRLSLRNKLAKYIKQPGITEKYESLSVFIDQETLRNISLEYHLQAIPTFADRPVLLLNQHPLYKNFFDSLSPFLSASAPGSDDLINLKLKEAVLTLLKVQPELKDVLFDFTDPHKIDLKAYMEQHYKFNLTMQHFAYMTGRSVSSFKRDFDQDFGTSPGKWLLNRRLKEAFYLLKEKGKAPSDVYVETGFEDISHFSRAFKKEYGFPPSKIYDKLNSATFQKLNSIL